MLALGLVDRFPLGLLLQGLALVLQALQVGQLLLELAVGGEALFGERPAGQRGPDPTPRFGFVAAVAEAAPLAQLDDIGEGAVQVLLFRPELDLANPRRVHHEGAPGQHEQLAVGGGVAPTVVAGPDFLGGLDLGPEQPVQQRRLPHSRGADERHGPAGPQPRLESLEPTPRLGAQGHDAGRGGQRLHLGDSGGHVRAQVGLREDEHRLRAAVPGQHQRPLQPPQVEVAVEARHQEQGVDVGGEDLLVRRLSGRLPRQPAAPRQHGVKGGPLLTGTGRGDHPVPHHRKVRRPRRLVAEAARNLGQQLALGRADAAELAEDGHDTGGHAAGAGVGQKGLGEERRPTVRLELDHEYSGTRRAHVHPRPAAGRRLAPKQGL